MANSSRGRARRTDDRPPKPYPDFPLSVHPGGKYMKKIRGRLHYFGRWAKLVGGKMVRLPGDGWEQALAEYKAVADDLHAGRTPRPQAGALTVANLLNHFLTSRKHKLDAGEITARTFAEYRSTADRMVRVFGKARLVDDLHADDFASYRAGLAKQYGPVRLGNEVQKVRTIFKYAVDNALVDRAVRFGSEFRKPNKKVMRIHRAKGGKKLFTRGEVAKLVAEAGVPLRAMVLLGINCAFGNSDVGSLPLTAVDLDAGWCEFPRPKTGIERRCPLWPETVSALRDALAERPTPKREDTANLVFVTKYGGPWADGGTATAVSHEFGKLLAKLGVSRKGVGFYTLRHTFRTVADATKDANAIRTVMGHTDASIDANYTHGIGDDRLRAVANHVHAWLYPPTQPNEPNGTGKKPAKPPGKRGKRPLGRLPNANPTTQRFGGGRG